MAKNLPISVVPHAEGILIKAPRNRRERIYALITTALMGEILNQQGQAGDEPDQVNSHSPKFSANDIAGLFQHQPDGTCRYVGPRAAIPANLPLLILYRRLLNGEESVRAETLNIDLESAGFSGPRLDRIMRALDGKVSTTGTTRGRRYRLTATGLLAAEATIDDVLKWYDSAATR